MRVAVGLCSYCDMFALSVVWLRQDKHVSAATDTHTIEKLLEAGFSTRSMPKPYNDSGGGNIRGLNLAAVKLRTVQVT
jgi:hypothetical protein